MPSIKIDVASSGDTTLVAADTNRRIRVLAYSLVCAAAVSVKFKSGSTDITGAMPFAANGGIAASVPGGTSSADERLFEAAAGSALVINLSGNVQVSGSLSYDLCR